MLLNIDIVFADIGNSDRSARMRILVKIVTARMFVCHHDTYCDILIFIFSDIADSDFMFFAMYNITCQSLWLSWIRSPTGDEEVAGSTPAEVGEIDSEIFSTVILSLPLISRRAVVSFWQKNVHNTG